MTTRPLYLGAALPIDGQGRLGQLQLPTHHLTTHSVIVGMTGSGKTGLAMTLVEETLRSKIPVLMIDVKGDPTNQQSSEKAVREAIDACARAFA